MSAVQLQQHLANAVSDGLHHPMVTRLSRLGGSPQDCHAGLMNLLRECRILDMIEPVPDAPSMQIILPSTLIQTIHRHYPQMFTARFGADRRSLRKFWRGFLSDAVRRDWASEHPCLRGQSAAMLETAIPLTVHEDAGPVTKAQGVVCLSFSALLGTGGEKVSKFLCSSWIKTERGTDAGPNAVWRRIIRDFDDLVSGKVGGEPVARDDDGTEWRFILLFA